MSDSQMAESEKNGQLPICFTSAWYMYIYVSVINQLLLVTFQSENQNQLLIWC